MHPENVVSTLVFGDTFDYALFKIAIAFAESGRSVWFISPTKFEKVPEKIRHPTRPILQLITFIYLQDHKRLIEHLNGTHSWHKLPSVIIARGFDSYSGLYSDNYNAMRAALVATSLLDSASFCARKLTLKTFLLVTCQTPEGDIHRSRVQIIADLYFPNRSSKPDDSEDSFCDSIVEMSKQEQL